MFTYIKIYNGAWNNFALRASHDILSVIRKKSVLKTIRKMSSNKVTAAIIDYLKQAITTGSISEEEKESLEVAGMCNPI